MTLPHVVRAPRRLVAIAAALWLAVCAPARAQQIGGMTTLGGGGGFCQNCARIETTDDAQTIVDGKPAGTVFLIASGYHRMQSITPRAGDTYVGDGGAVLSGARLLPSTVGGAGWTADGGSRWYVTGQTQEGSLDGVCRDTEDQCQHPEDLWFDDVIQHHVGTLGEVSDGTWFFDYAADRIYIGTNPTGRKVETGVTRAAFLAEGSPVAGVTIQNLTIEKYASVGNTAAINAPNGTTWLVQGCTLRWNHAAGVGVGNNGRIVSNLMQYNGQNGVRGYSATGLLISGNELSYNGSLFDPYWGSGGAKVAFIDNSVIASNFVHHNFGPGIWCDIDCKAITIRDNTTNDNDQSGIFYEISFDALIYNNIVRRNGLLTGGGGPTEAGILISESANVEVYGNTVEDNSWGIYAYQEARGNSTAYTVKWAVTDLNVHDNIVKTAGRIGLDQTEGDNSYFTSKNNHFEANTYTLQTTTNHFTWNNATANSFGTWQGFGNDSPVGSATTY